MQAADHPVGCFFRRGQEGRIGPRAKELSTSLRDHARAPLAVGSPWIGWSAAAAVERNDRFRMTFYEAALQILLREGKPLHANAITELAIKESLLSHVGKQPEITMAAQLAAMARRSADRRLIAVEPDTFGLTDWSVEPSEEALEKSGVVERPDENEPPLRGRERHPRIDKENVRIAGRGDRRRKYEELERKKKKKKKRLPPLAELVYDIVDRAGRPLPVFEVAAAIREHDLVAEDIGREALENALRSENERREGEGRKPVFDFPEGGLVGLSGQAVPEEEVDLPALVARVVGRLAEERKPAAVEAVVAVGAAAPIDQMVADARGRAVAQLRQRLAELDAVALEAVAQTMLDTLGYRDVRVAKRHKDGSLYTCRRRMGLTEVRYAVRVIRGGREVRREDVLELRRDLQSHSAQMGVLLSPSDVTREGKSEAAQAGGALVALLCADALADQLAERGMGVRQRTVTFTEFDPAAFRSLAAAGAPAPAAGATAETRRESAADRRERREKERREWREKRAKEREERRKAREAAAAAAAQAEAGAAAEEGPIAAERAVSHPAEQVAAPHAVEETQAGVTSAAQPAPEGAPAEQVAPAEAAAVEVPEAAPAEAVVPAARETPAPGEQVEAPAAPAPAAEAAPARPIAPEEKPVAAAKAEAPVAATEAAEPTVAPQPEAAAEEEEAPDRPRRRRRRTRAAGPEVEAAPAEGAEETSTEPTPGEPETEG